MGKPWLLAMVLAVSATAAAARPNVLFLAVDDLRPQLGCYGQAEIKSPNIDRLAARGVLFNRGYCQFSHCGPSRASLLSGVRPGHRPRAKDLPELFKDKGYFCEAMGKVYHGSFVKELDRTNANNPAAWSVPAWYPPPRFYFSDEGIAEARRRFGPMAKKMGVSLADWTNHIVRAAATGAPEVDDGIPRDGQIAQRAVRRLGELGGCQPFFLAVGFMGTHLPFVAPKKYWDLYPADQIVLPDNMYAPRGAPDFSLIPTIELGQYTGLADILSNRQTARHLIRGYYACVSYVDSLIGNVLDALDQSGLRDNTIIVLWGDNGWKLGEHNAWSKYSDYEDDTRVPVLISVPGLETAGTRTDALVELVDLYPTLCELCGISVPDSLEGVSMVPLLRNPRLPWKTAAFSEIPRNTTGGSVFKYDGKGYSIRTDRYRLVLWVRAEKGKPRSLREGVPPDEVVAVELYDHIKDPGENVNCAGNPEYHDVVQTLTKQLLAGWKADPGLHTISVGSSSGTLPLQGNYLLKPIIK